MGAHTLSGSLSPLTKQFSFYPSLWLHNKTLGKVVRGERAAPQHSFHLCCSYLFCLWNSFTSSLVLAHEVKNSLPVVPSPVACYFGNGLAVGVGNRWPSDSLILRPQETSLPQLGAVVDLLCFVPKALSSTSLDSTSLFRAGWALGWCGSGAESSDQRPVQGALSSLLPEGKYKMSECAGHTRNPEQ